MPHVPGPATEKVSDPPTTSGVDPAAPTGCLLLRRIHQLHGAEEAAVGELVRIAKKVAVLSELRPLDL